MNIFVSRKLPSSVISRLESVGRVDVFAGNGSITADELRTAVAGKHALITMLTEHVDGALLDAGTDLKIVANVAVGFNNIDVAAARSRGVVVTNTPDVLTDSVADFTWALILAITRRLAEGDRVVRSGAWKGWAFDYMLGSELRG
jgi:glyoxylate reductase